MENRERVRKLQHENDAKFYEKKCAAQEEEINDLMKIAERSSKNNIILKKKFDSQINSIINDKNLLKDINIKLQNEISQATQILCKEKIKNQELCKSLNFKSEELDSILISNNALKTEVTKLKELLQLQTVEYDKKLEESVKHIANQVHNLSQSQATFDTKFDDYDEVLQQISGERDLVLLKLEETEKLLDIATKKAEKLKIENDILLKENTFPQSNEQPQNVAVLETNKQLQEKLKWLESELLVVQKNNINLKSKDKDLSEELYEMNGLCKTLHEQLAEKEEQLIEMEKVLDSRVEAENSLKLKFEQREGQLNKLDEMNIKLQDQVVKMKDELKSNMSILEKLRSENETIKKAAKSNLAIYEKNLKVLENERNKLISKLKLKNGNDEGLQNQLKLLENKLEITKHDRDMKIVNINQLHKISEEMKLFAEESKIHQNKLNTENQELRNSAYELQHKLNLCQAERDEYQSESCVLQQKIIEAERAHNKFISNMKDVETKLRAELLQVEARNKEATALQYDIKFKRDSAIKEKEAAEKQLESTTLELTKNHLKLKNKENECNKLTEKLQEYETRMENLTEETNKLRKIQFNYKEQIIRIENDSKKLKDKIFERTLEYNELCEKYDQLNTKFNDAQGPANERFKLKNENKILKKSNDDLNERCRALEIDASFLSGELEELEGKLGDLNDQKNEIQMKYDELCRENVKLNSKTEQFHLIEANKNLLEEKCASLTSNCNDLSSKILDLEQELSTKVKAFSIIEEQNLSLAKDYGELKTELTLLKEKNTELEEKLKLESKMKQQLENDFEKLLTSEAKLISDIENLALEKENIEKLMREKEFNIEKLEKLNSQLISKCGDFDSKDIIQFSKEKCDIATESIRNLQSESPAMKKNNDELLAKLKKYYSKCIKLKKENENLGKECSEVKHICNELRLNVASINSKNEEFESLKQSMKKYLCRQQTLAKQRLQKIQAVVDSFSSQQRTGNETMEQLNSLLDRCKRMETSEPAASQIMDICKNIKNQISKEKEENQQGLELLNLLKSNLFTPNLE